MSQAITLGFEWLLACCRVGSEKGRAARWRRRSASNPWNLEASVGEAATALTLHYTTQRDAGTALGFSFP